VVTAICPKCKTPVPIEEYQPEVLNSERVSTVSLAHNEGTDCPACGEYLIPAIVQFSIDIGLVARPRPQTASKILSVGALPFNLAKGGN